MQTQSGRAGRNPAAGDCAPEIARLWKEPRRVEQIARITGLHLQSCDREGQCAWQEAQRIHAQLPTGVRIDLPSPRVFARVLGFYRSTATLKHRPMLDLELSVKDIAQAVGYGKSAVEAALRWLGSEPIVYCGLQVARGLGYINRARRKAKAYVHGVLQNVYRTSQTCLTFLGRGLLGLAALPNLVGRSLVPPKRGNRQRQPGVDVVAPGAASAHSWAVGLDAVRCVRMQL